MNPPSAPEPWLIAGPTGAGKSRLAAALAQKVGGEIVCADALQIYAGLPILTAQPGPELLALAPHHLYGILPPDTPCNAALWLKHTLPLIAAIQSRGRRPILTGGTGLYFRVFTHGLDPAPPPDPHLRAELSALPLPELTRRLLHADPRASALLDLKNPRRVLRALEIILLTGQPLAAFRRRWSLPPLRPHRALLLARQPQDLRHRIAENVHSLWKNGAIAEVQAILATHPHLADTPTAAAQAIGFLPITRFLKGTLSEAETLTLITRQTWAYARRQTTWFRNQTSWPTLTAPPGLPHSPDQALALLSSPAVPE